MRISIIAAIGKNRELGKSNRLLWHIPEDMERFRELTKGHPIIMGRKTWESLPTKPLPNRYNIVITRDLGFRINGLREGKGFAVVSSLEEAIKIAKRHSGGSRNIGTTPESDSGRVRSSLARMTTKEQEIFIIGGGQIFEQAMSLTDKLYLTVIDSSFDADIFFPDYSEFKKVIFEQSGESGGYKYKFLELER